MSSPRPDARVTRSRAALVEAVEAILDEGRWADLTIGGLCSRAGVSRPTFYQHFSSPEDVLGTTIRQRLEESRALACAGTGETEAAEILVASLVQLDDKRHEYAHLAEQPAVYAQVQVVVQDWLAGRVRDEFPDADEVAVAYAAGGISRVVSEWLAHDADRIDAPDLVRRLWFHNRAVLGVTD